MNWTPIEDYEADPVEHEYSELQALAKVWHDRRPELEQRDSFSEFKARLHREWAIETGLIERLYTLDRGVTELLIQNGIRAELIPHSSSSSSHTIVNMINDHQNAIDWIIDFVNGKRPLSTAYVKELHALMTRHQANTEAIDRFGNSVSTKLVKGEYKDKPNNPRRPDGTIHIYCPPEHVASEMDRLIDLHEQHNQHNTSPEVESAWLHHRFTSIHPFQDGNGRVARAIASLVFIKAGWFPIVVRDSDRTEYMDALEKADQGSLHELVSLFVKLQKRHFLSALTIAQETEKQKLVDDAIQATKERLKLKKDSLELEWNRACEHAERLCKFANDRQKSVAEDLSRELAPILAGGNYFADCELNEGRRSHYFRKQIIEAAKALGYYYVNTRTYRSWTRLVLSDGVRGEFLVSFHGMGQDFNGLLACSGIWFERSENEEGHKELTPAISLSDQVFIINYKETLDEIQERFAEWLDKCTVQSLSLFESGAMDSLQ